MNALPNLGPLPFRAPSPCVERRDDGSILVWQDHVVPSQEKSIAHLFAKRASEAGERILIAQRDAESDAKPWVTATYGEMLSRALRVAAGLLALGLGPGDRLLVLSGESLNHAALMFGAIFARVVIVPISVGYSLAADHARLAHVIRLIRPQLVYAEDASRFGGAFETAATAGIETLTGDVERLGAALSPLILDTALHEIDSDTVLKIILTSGTSGVPKAVLQTHGMSCASLAFEEATSTLPPNPHPASVLVDWLPWSHVGGGITILNNVLSAGASLYLDDGRPVAGRFAPTIENLTEFPPETYSSPPAATAMLVEEMDANPEFRHRFFQHLLYVKYGGAALSEGIYRRFQEHSRAAIGRDTPFLTGYGTTETHGVISLTWRMDQFDVIGLPKPGVIVKLHPMDERMEIRIKSASVTPGYFGDENATVAAFDEEGFFRTGDSAAFDPDRPLDGLRFTGRIGDNFKVATGTWVASNVVREAVLRLIGDEVDECVILGEGRSEIGALLWARNGDVSAARHSRVLRALEQFNREAGGSSGRIVKIAFSAKPISAEKFERTEKGTLNRPLILANRRDEIEAMYS